jgi:hypothetical protein
MPIPRPERFLITLALGGLAAGAEKKLPLAQEPLPGSRWCLFWLSSLRDLA